MNDRRSDKVRALVVIENCYKSQIEDQDAEHSTWDDPRRKVAWDRALVLAAEFLNRPLTNDEITSAMFRFG